MFKLPVSLKESMKDPRVLIGGFEAIKRETLPCLNLHCVKDRSGVFLAKSASMARCTGNSFLDFPRPRQTTRRYGVTTLRLTISSACFRIYRIATANVDRPLRFSRSLSFS